MKTEQKPLLSQAEAVFGPFSGCVLALKQAAGEEVLANAAGIVAMFSAMTMVVDVAWRFFLFFGLRFGYIYKFYKN